MSETRSDRLRDELAEMTRQRDELRAALKGLADLYGYAWDLVDGGLMMMPAGVAKFETVYARALKALKATEPKP